MKRYIICLTVVCSFFLSGCHFLEVERLGKNDIPKFFSDISGARLAVIGTYRDYYNLQDSYYLKYSEAAADMVYLDPIKEDMKNEYNFLSIPSQETNVAGQMWTKGYAALASVNHLVYYTEQLKPKYPRNEDELNSIIAEGLFMRGMLHLMICNCFGQPYNFTADASHPGIPVTRQIESVNAKIKRSTVKEVYASIVSDLEEAIVRFGTRSTKGVYYSSPMACKALLARVYLYMEQWDKAEALASQVIQSKALSTGDNYLKMFTSENGNEAIFRVSGYNISTHSLRKFYLKDDRVTTMSNKYIATFYSNEDIRKHLLDGSNSLKYDYGDDYTDSKPESELFYAPIILRVSEMYLIRAEARCRQNNLTGAADDLKEIMARSQEKTVPEITLTYSSSDQLLSLIQRERILELSLEGHRFFDILRYKQDLVRDNNTTSSVKSLTYPNVKFVLPLTTIEIENNPGIEQNPGY